ncbi:MAG: 50S ribosomal protein L11 methyltransferase [Thermoleophilia bacterium]
MNERDLIRIEAVVAAADAERATAEACAALGTGCMEEDGPDGTVRLSLWTAPGSADLDRLRAALAAAGIAAAVEAGPEDPAWQDAMRRFHRPVAIAGRLLVRPPWEPARPPLLDVVIDPGMAFGTAQHATTRACLTMLARLDAGGPLLDAGCGSGVLSIAARRLGWDPVTAVDHDPLSVDATLANARRNGVALTVARRTIGADRLPAAPTVMANLTGTVLRMLAVALPPPAPRHLVASGMRPEEVDGVVAAFAPAGLGAADRIDDDGWSTVLLTA